MPAASGPHIHLRSEESHGEVSIVETAPAPGTGPRLHAHDFDEAFYVLEGTLVFQLGDEFVKAGPGDLVFARRGVPHTFANLTDSPARQLIVCTPAGFERSFARMAADRLGVEPPEWAMQPIPGVTALGPPIDPDAVRTAPVRRLAGASGPPAAEHPAPTPRASS